MVIAHNLGGDDETVRKVVKAFDRRWLEGLKRRFSCLIKARGVAVPPDGLDQPSWGESFAPGSETIRFL